MTAELQGGRIEGCDAGLSLVEVMVAMGIFVIGSLSLLSVLTSGMNGTHDNRARVTAANLAAADIDEARSLRYQDLVTTVLPAKEVDGRFYRVTRSVDVTLANGASSCIGSTSNKQRYKRVTTTVTNAVGKPKAFRGGTRPVRADTLVKAPVFDPNNPLGAIAFVVVDREGTPISGVPVATSSTTLTSDARGCAFFDGLPPGTQVVTVTRPGSVKIDGSSTLSKSVGVTAGQITSDVLRIDVAATITVMSNVYEGTTVRTGYELPPGLSARLSAPDRATLTRFESAAKPLTAGVDVTWTSYPSPGGYDAYLGPCSAVAHTNSEPGTTPPRLVLPLSPVRVNLIGSSGMVNDRVRSKTVTATWRGAGCTEVITWTSRTGTLCQATSNGADQCHVTVGVPSGDWRFTITENGYGADEVVDPRTAETVTIDVGS